MKRFLIEYQCLFSSTTGFWKTYQRHLNMYMTRSSG
jgi:hypothetical protein